ncbi:hypothetical protein N2152v2_010947 [Parachlorella kessleri]
MTSGHQTAGFTDLPGDLIARIAESLTPKDRARLLCCTRRLWQLSYGLGGLWEELEVWLSLQEAQALAPFLQRRRHLVHSLTLWLSDSQPRIVIDGGEVVRQLVHSLADGALHKLSASLGDYNLTLGSWLDALPHLSELCISGGRASTVTIAASLSRLTTLTSLEVWECASGLPEDCLPTSLRSLSLAIRYAGPRPRLPDALAAATALEQLTLENLLDDAEGLQQLQNLTSLTLVTGELGVPHQVAELLALRSLKLHPEVVHAEQLSMLAKLTNLTSLSMGPQEGGYAPEILAPLPSELLTLPNLLDLYILACLPPLGISGPVPVAPSLQHLSVSIAAFASSPAALAALTSLTFLHLNCLLNEDDCPPLAAAAVTTLMLTLATLPRLVSLAWTAAFPLEGAAADRLAQAQASAGDAAAAGHAGGEQAQQDPQQPNQQQQDQAPAPQAAAPPQLPSAASAPAWPQIIQHGFAALEELGIDFVGLKDDWVNIVGAEQLSPWLGLPGWLGCMRGLKRAKLAGAGEVTSTLREALAPGVALHILWY